MSRLSSADLERALIAAGEWHRATTFAELAGIAVTTLNELISCDGIGWNEIDVQGRESRILTLPSDYLIPVRLEALNRMIEQHPLVAHVESTGDLSAHAISDFVPTRELHRREIYADFFRPLGIEEMLAVMVRTSPALIGIAFTRSHRTFLERDRILLNLLQPHLVAAYDGVAARIEARTRIAALERGLDGREIVVLTPSGRAENPSPMRERWFNSTSDPPAPGVYERDDARLTVRRVAGDPPMLLLDEHRSQPGPQRIRELGLTRRQAEVLVLAGRGLSDAAIAERLFLSSRTVSKHLQHTFDKLGVRTRAAAAARLLEP